MKNFLGELIKNLFYFAYNFSAFLLINHSIRTSSLVVSEEFLHNEHDKIETQRTNKYPTKMKKLSF